MKIRIRYQKTGCMKFVGHLDIMRYFQRAIRRAGIDICYSEGFSPHPIMSFASPLGVGITSDGEYFDIEVNSSLNTESEIKALNDTMVEGIRILEYKKLPDNAKTAMSIIASSDYELSYKEGYEAPFTAAEWGDKIQEVYTSKDQFVILKKTKKSEKEVDIKPLVYDLKVTEKDGKPCFYLFVSTGSLDNIKPELVLASLYQACGLEYDPLSIQIHRLDTYTRAEDGSFLSLGAMGEDI